MDLQPSSGLFEHGLRVMENGQAVVIEGLHGAGHGRPVPGPPAEIRLFLANGLLCCLWRVTTDRLAMQQQLVEAERRYRLLARHTSDVVVELDSDHRIVWVSESIEARLGWRPDALIGQPAIGLVHREEWVQVLRAGLSLAGPGSFREDLRILCADGGWLWMMGTAHPLPGEEAGALVLSLRDIHDQVRIRTELDHRLQHDPLTSLPLRSVALDRIRHALDGLEGTGSSLTVLSIGVDGLTQVNDALTHAGGDKLIALLAARIVRAIGHPEQVGRGTGDEFIVLLSEQDAGADVTLTAERILRACRVPVSIAGQPIDPTVSIGIATARAGVLPDELLRDASLAMRQAKGRGRNCYALLDDALATEAHTLLLFAAEIQRGLVMGEFAAWFMPIVAFDTGQVTGYEALARWVRPDGIEVPPAEFLPCAECRGLITRIDLLVLRQALAALSRLPPTLTMAVNVSAATLALPDYPQLVSEALRAAQVVPERLHLEVTETALLTVTDRIGQQIQQLASSGVRWYVDDFGTGYSSISHLRDLPIAGLKLDRSFTCAMRAKDTKSLRLAQALVGVAEGLELDTVAEGVETIEEARLLTSQGWLHGQGWLYGKAAPLQLDTAPGPL
ncbi:bifunctional diguanylate cyclase/phosphodiesterase [Cyanobium gracile]|uniref:Bifunctional diguanylate cyclase/phosphodiesterase n=1 Tax=Cyanobium gracile UHCC 0281 TaxID=3110309 RepID=A0ABU5SYL0_9CYAN|nr:bifunctional diguanylate cyclase/phosphodiesterase [Cyanobium gracile]MEA5443604.1 bifunctional diguanylate cyclase/phosphodiesterase [Cyanobium gracile UHCC 0281]